MCKGMGTSGQVSRGTLTFSSAVVWAAQSEEQWLETDQEG